MKIDHKERNKIFIQQGFRNDYLHNIFQSNEQNIEDRRSV